MPKTIRQLCIISGKGGTGKTTVAAALAALWSDRKVLADCDVDAANLHLVLGAEASQSNPFVAGVTAWIDPVLCSSCGVCLEECRFEAIRVSDSLYSVDRLACEGCGVCKQVCSEDAVTLEETEVGEVYESETRFGRLVHAVLHAGRENSGKLVMNVRERAVAHAKESHIGTILIDGPPGIGCPVIASLSGVDLALIVTEPTITGFQATERILRVTQHFNVPTVACVNKVDLHPAAVREIKALCSEFGSEVIARLPFDRAVVEALVQLRPVPEDPSSPISRALADLAEMLESKLGETIGINAAPAE